MLGGAPKAHKVKPEVIAGHLWEVSRLRAVNEQPDAIPGEKFGKSDVCDFFAEIDFRHGSRFRR
jgi:hypothetical protein